MIMKTGTKCLSADESHECILFRPPLLNNGSAVKILYQIKRPKLTFIEDATQVFPDDAKEEKLDTTNEKNDGDE